MAATKEGIVAAVNNLSISQVPDDHSSEQVETTTLLSLPDELLEVITLDLKTSNKMHSLSNLELCCKRFRGVTDEVLWKEVQWKKDTWSTVGGIGEQERPAGWKFVQYIVFNGRVSQFCHGLRATQGVLGLLLPVESLLLSYWPNLKAVIDMVGGSFPGFAPTSASHDVWLMTGNALGPIIEFDRTNPIDRVIRLLYGDDLFYARPYMPYPIFTTDYRFASVNILKLGPTLSGDTVLVATLVTRQVLFQFYVTQIDSRQSPPQLFTEDIPRWISRLFYLVRAAFPTPQVFTMAVKCEQKAEIWKWLLWLEVERVNAPDLEPFHLEASLSNFLGLEELPKSFALIQEELTCTIEQEMKTKAFTGKTFPIDSFFTVPGVTISSTSRLLLRPESYVMFAFDSQERKSDCTDAEL